MGMLKVLLQGIYFSICDGMIDPQPQGVCGQGNLLKLSFDIQEIRDFFFGYPAVRRYLDKAVFFFFQRIKGR